MAVQQEQHNLTNSMPTFSCGGSEARSRMLSTSLLCTIMHKLQSCIDMVKHRESAIGTELSRLAVYSSFVVFTSDSFLYNYI